MDFGRSPPSGGIVVAPGQPLFTALRPMLTWSHLRRFLLDEEGYILSTELVLWTSLVGFGIIVGLATLRWAVLDVYKDAGESLASREAGVWVFDTSDSRLYFQMPYPSLFELDPDLGTSTGGNQPIDASGSENP